MLRNQFIAAYLCCDLRRLERLLARRPALTVHQIADALCVNAMALTHLLGSAPDRLDPIEGRAHGDGNHPHEAIEVTEIPLELSSAVHPALFRVLVWLSVPSQRWGTLPSAVRMRVRSSFVWLAMPSQRLTTAQALRQAVFRLRLWLASWF